MGGNAEYVEILRILASLSKKEKLQIISFLRALKGSEDSLPPHASALEIKT